MIKLLKNTETSLSPIVDPFHAKLIDGMSFMLHSWGEKKYWIGSVSFKNGQTEGKYRTKEYDMDQFEECVKDVERAIKSKT